MSPPIFEVYQGFDPRPYGSFPTNASGRMARSCSPLSHPGVPHSRSITRSSAWFGGLQALLVAHAFVLLVGRSHQAFCFQLSAWPPRSPKDGRWPLHHVSEHGDVTEESADMDAVAFWFPFKTYHEGGPPQKGPPK